MAKINPALREKKRYVVFEVMGNAESNDAVDAVRDSFRSLFGAVDAAGAAISGVRSEGCRFMVRVGRRHVDRLKAAAIMVKSIKNSAVILRSIGASGSVRGAAEKYFGA